LAATYITTAELRTLLGIGSLYSDSVVEEVCQAAENIVKGYLWFNKAYIASTELTSLTATVTTINPHGFVVGQSVVISESGSVFNGTRTITAATIKTAAGVTTAAGKIGCGCECESGCCGSGCCGSGCCGSGCGCS
jgi:hypothetical protein